ncbi:hypothetical protein AWC38_SpisGene16515 [Stylophora pistillata]|uniref:Uncharacterized protein n=1 Tax=Stylophora pistillata TaxID=50429 RepID=A0A2B4RS51_STYPI|nr:hypothetical protein AWC38_SpisGene16515 [Stylophora pistillata]
MTVSLTPSKAMKVKPKAVKWLHNQSPTIRTVSEVIDLTVASFPGVMHGPLYYRPLEIEKGTSESGTGPAPGYKHCANVEHSSLVPQIATSFDRLSSYSSKGTKNTAPPFQSGESTPSSQEAHPSSVQIIRNSLTARGISQKAAKVILQSWRETTHRQDSIYLRKWPLFCSSRGFDPYKATPAQVLDFLTDLFEQGLGYSAMNTVKSPLSQVLHSPTGVPFGELPTVKQFLKGVLQEKPTLPR